MNGYSKIGTTTTTSHKSRSIDFSDFFSFPKTPKPIITSLPNHQEEPIDDINDVKKKSKSEEDEDEESGKGERFGVILGRSCSVSSSSSASGFQATMKRAFSMRRSSSVSERYCRIHDQNMAIASDELDIINIDATENKNKTTRSVKIKKGGGNILRVCKRLLGF